MVGLGTRSVGLVAERGGRQWPMLVVLLLGQFMGLLDVYVVNVATPTIGVDLHASGASLQLIVGAYTIAYAMLLITGARLGDIYGRRRMYLLGVVGFTVGSLVCGLAPDSAVLIGARCVQGAAAAVMVPQIISVIQMRFVGRARAKALSAYAVVLSVGSVAGLVVGGILVSANLFGTGWRPVFLVNVPIGIVLAFLVPRLVPADQARGSRRLDLRGLLVAAPSVVLIVLPLVLGHELHWPAWAFVCIAVGLLLAYGFVRLQRRIAGRGGDPLLNLAVLRARGIGWALITLSCLMVSYGGFLFCYTLHLQSGLGDSALRAGFTWLPMAVAFGLGGYYWRVLPVRIHHVLPLFGLVACALADLGIAVSAGDGSMDSALMWVSLILFGAGAGVTMSLLTHALVHVPQSLAADASGVLTTTMQLGQLIGVAGFGTVFLTLAAPPGSGVSAALSMHAISTTAYWLALLPALGVVGGIAVAVTVRRARLMEAAQAEVIQTEAVPDEVMEAEAA
jgi:MFS family permease